MTVAEVLSLEISALITGFEAKEFKKLIPYLLAPVGRGVSNACPSPAPVMVIVIKLLEFVAVTPGPTKLKPVAAVVS
jgi:hypothetical protein